MHNACHHCDYDLIGLPDKGTCPECGEYYDKHSVYRAVQAKEPAFLKHIKWVFLASVTLLVLLGGTLLAIDADHPIRVIIVTLLIASVPGFGTFVYWWSPRQEQRQAD